MPHLSGGSETHRAVMQQTMSTGGVSADANSLQANEDREIVGINFADTGAEAAVQEASFSSDAALATGNDDNAKASTIAVSQGSTFVEFDDPINWSAGEEIHVHTRNNTGATQVGFIVVHYREV